MGMETKKEKITIEELYKSLLSGNLLILLGVDRLLYGSDMPGNYISNLGQIMDLDISNEDREKIFYKNTLKLFDTNFRLGGGK